MISSAEADTEPAMWGRATMAIVESSDVMIVASMIEIRIMVRLGPGGSGDDRLTGSTSHGRAAGRPGLHRLTARPSTGADGRRSQPVQAVRRAIALWTPSSGGGPPSSTRAPMVLTLPAAMPAWNIAAILSAPSGDASVSSRAIGRMVW